MSHPVEDSPEAQERVSDRHGAFQRLWSGAPQREALLDFWRVYDRCYDEIAREGTALAMDHPEFGVILRGMTAEDRATSDRESKVRLERAIAGEWAPYEAN